MAEPEIRELTSLEELRDAAELYERVWGERRVLTAELMRALSTHGSELLGAYVDGRMVGAQTAFLAREDGELSLHSHVTAVDPELQHHGIGAALKWAQRDWALAHGIDLVTWTFDPMIARNAYFNLRKLGAEATRFLRSFYGELEDAFNAGERTDRLEITWRLRDSRVEAASAGSDAAAEADGAAPLLEEKGGRPVPQDSDADLALVRVPSDYLGLRERDRALASAWRDAVADALEGALGRGYVAVDFQREGAYVLERR